MIQLFTDGSCFPNPGPGGWAAIAVWPDGQQQEWAGPGEYPTTNSRMELLAVIEGLQRIPPQARVHVHSDSEYVVKNYTLRLGSWVAAGWRRRTGGPVANADLWAMLVAAAMRQQVVQFTWLRGHSGTTLNERADVLAGEQRLAVTAAQRQEEA